MNILIPCSQYNTFLTASGEHATALLALVPHLRIVEQSGYGDSLTYKVEELPPKVEFIDSAKLAGMSETEQRLARALDSKNTEWATAYTENNKNKALVAELQRQLASLQQAA